MKKLIAISFLIISLLLIPFQSFASFAGIWVATSTTSGIISPARINGNDQAIQVPYVFATSSTATSTFLGGFVVGPIASPTFSVDTAGNDVYTSGLRMGSDLRMNSNAIDFGNRDSTFPSIYGYASNQIGLQSNTSSNSAVLDLSKISADRIQSLPDWSGEFAVSTSTLQVSAINATSTTATSTFAGNASFVGDNFAIDSTGIQDTATLRWGAGSKLYEQSAALGGTDRMIYQPNGDRFDILNESGSTVIARFQPSLTYLNSTNVGIATDTPAAKLAVNGVIYTNTSIGINTSAPSRGLLEIRQTGTTNASGLAITDPGITASARWYIDGSGVQRIDNGISAAGNIAINGAGTGKVGVATTTPDSSLTVYGTTFPVMHLERDKAGSGSGTIYGAMSQEILNNSIGVADMGAGTYFKAPNSTGASTYAGFFGGRLHTIAAASSQGDVFFNPSYAGNDPSVTLSAPLILRATSISAGLALFPQSSVGIGTSTPAAPLTVTGTASNSLDGGNNILQIEDGTLTNGNGRFAFILNRNKQNDFTLYNRGAGTDTFYDDGLNHFAIGTSTALASRFSVVGVLGSQDNLLTVSSTTATNVVSNILTVDAMGSTTVDSNLYVPSGHYFSVGGLAKTSSGYTSGRVQIIGTNVFVDNGFGFTSTSHTSAVMMPEDVDSQSKFTAYGGQKFLVYDYSAYNEYMRLTGALITGYRNQGRLGLATTTPGARLSIDQFSTTTTGFYLAGASNAIAPMFVISTSTPTATSTVFTIDNNGFIVYPAGSSTPPTSSSACQQGKIQWDDSFIYICTKTNTWRRATLSAF